jgi:hypothetical protein
MRLQHGGTGCGNRAARPPGRLPGPAMGSLAEVERRYTVEVVRYHGLFGGDEAAQRVPLFIRRRQLWRAAQLGNDIYFSLAEVDGSRSAAEASSLMWCRLPKRYLVASIGALLRRRVELGRCHAGPCKKRVDAPADRASSA